MDERLQNLTSLLEETFKGLNELQESNKRFQGVLIQSRILRKTVIDVGKNFSEQLQDGHASLAESLKRGIALSKELSEAKPEVPGKITPEDLAKRLQSVIENSQLEARRPKAGGLAATLRSMDVELKGFIVVEDDKPQIVPPSPARGADAAQLSTIRMSFGTVPVIGTEEAGAPEAPQKPG